MYIEHDLEGRISKVDGIAYQIVLWLSKRFNFTFNLVEPPDRTFGAVVNNTWNGMIAMTINRNVDLVAGPVIPSEARAKVIDFSISFLDEPADCLIPAPTLDENKWNAVFKPFHYNVWLMVIVSLASVAVVSWMTMNLYWKWRYDGSASPGSPHFVLSFNQHVLSALALFCSQGQHTAARAPHSNRIAISSWCLMSTVLVYAYSSCIISYLTIPKSHLLVNSVEELANSQVLQVATHKNSFFEATLLQSSYGPLKLLGDSLRNNPENSFGGQYYNQTRLLNKVFGRLALITARLQLEMLIELHYRQTRRCELTFLPQQFMPILKTCLALPKGSPYIHLINLGITEIKQLGLVDRWIKVNINQTNQCKHGVDIFQHHSNSEIKHPLALSNLAGAFILLLLGVSVSISTFLCEVCVSKNRNQH
ncbi:glutamate [NMDA] receptor subunit 1-like [Daphnia carinata]|uniref:glutamate [NMDA] receptor subunit 1-like n=1 Tax=Daphnia carinata TaxID=120202 RepID=UPI00257D8F63|nr:glutamate [NMDA] receptor subunit 1-like [Daphnia carinata]